MSPSAGETVVGRFELREQVGSGGFATVWRARDAHRDADVALKCADTSTHDRAEVRARFDREIETLGRFEGTIAPSSVVRYLDGGIDPTPYVALEYLPEPPLSDRLGTGGLGTSVRRRVVVDLAETMDFLHRNGVVYLDLRPENVIVRTSGRPVLLDFNTAATADGPIETRFEADQFKPPELLPAVEGAEGADEPGPWSDVYAWGKLAFYLFTDAKVLPEDVPADGLDPLAFGGTCSRAVAEVVQRATIPDPAERYEDGTVAAGALARATGRQRALLTQPSTGVACPVADGETMGRLAEDSPAAWIVLPDEDRHVSPRHARFEYTLEGWVVEDTSLNGTYVGGPDGWTHLLSERGQEAREGATGGASEALVPEGATIAPVHPEYGIELWLSPLNDRDSSRGGTAG